MTDPIEAIRLYVIHPDRNGLHLRQLAEKMAADEPAQRGFITAQVRERNVAAAAGIIARYINLVWGSSAGPETYSPRMYEILLGLQGRMRGMVPHDAWEYALAALGEDIRRRLRKANAIAIDPAMESELMGRFFDESDEHQYLRDVAEKVMDLHWHRRHGPGAITTEEVGRGRGRLRCGASRRSRSTFSSSPARAWPRTSSRPTSAGATSTTRTIPSSSCATASRSRSASAERTPTRGRNPRGGWAISSSDDSARPPHATKPGPHAPDGAPPSCPAGATVRGSWLSTDPVVQRRFGAGRFPTIPRAACVSRGEV